MKYIGEIFAIASGLLYGSIGYFAVHAMRLGMSVSQISFWRFSLAALILILILVVKNLNEDKSVFKKYLFRMLTVDSVLYTASSFAYFKAIKYIGSGLCMVVFFIYPLFVAIINTFLYGTKLSKRYWVCLSFIILGIVLLVDLGDLKMDMLGIFLSILSSLLYALYCISSNKTKSIPISATAMVCCGAAFFSLCSLLLDDQFPTLPNNFELQSLYYLVGLVIFGTVLPIALLLKSFSLISIERASVLSVSEPLFGVMIGSLLLGESITALQGLGIVVVVVAATLVILEG